MSACFVHKYPFLRLATLDIVFFSVLGDWDAVDGVLKMNHYFPAVKGTLLSRFGVGLKFAYIISLAREYIMDPYRICTISYETYFLKFRLDNYKIKIINT